MIYVEFTDMYVSACIHIHHIRYNHIYIRLHIQIHIINIYYIMNNFCSFCFEDLAAAKYKPGRTIPLCLILRLLVTNPLCSLS